MGKRRQNEQPLGNSESPERCRERHRPSVMVYPVEKGMLENHSPEHHLEETFDLWLVPFEHNRSFLMHDAVIVFAGSFEHWTSSSCGSCLRTRSQSDLDRRHRELYSLIREGIPVVFLTPPILRSHRGEALPNNTDLFRRILSDLTIDWDDFGDGRDPSPSCSIVEFNDFMRCYGTASVSFDLDIAQANTTPIAITEGMPVAFEAARGLFFLPCYAPIRVGQYRSMAAEAAAAVLAYRARLNKAMPAWTDDFRFAKEEALRKLIGDCQQTLATLEANLQPYTERKGLLCYQSEPLVEIVTELLQSVFGLNITAEDEKIEDANVVDEEGKRLAVIEIKGITGSFQRKQINQVDDHRERLGVEHLPGIVILNNKRNATSLTQKDEAPKADIIQKAKADHVLLIRTLDLLRFADLIDQGKKTQDDFREIILNESGWLCVEGDDVSVRTE